MNVGRHRAWRSWLVAAAAVAAAVAASSEAHTRRVVAADEPSLLRAADVVYAEGNAGRESGRTLDVYGPAAAAGAGRPIVLFVHGGGWRMGDKAVVRTKPAAFVDGGCLFASTNYRLDAGVSPVDQARDVAAAVRWLHEHGGEHGGDPGKMFLMGHSAGAHLAALVAIDGRFLKECGLDLRAVRGVILLDGAGYDVPRQMAAARLPRLQELYRSAFGDDPAFQREASPITHVAACFTWGIGRTAASRRNHWRSVWRTPASGRRRSTNRTRRT